MVEPSDEPTLVSVTQRCVTPANWRTHLAINAGDGSEPMSAVYGPTIQLRFTNVFAQIQFKEFLQLGEAISL